MNDTPKTDCRANNPKRDKFDIASIVILFLTFLAASGAAAFTGYLAFTAKHTEEVQLRPYIGVTNIQILCGTCDVVGWNPTLPLLSDKDAFVVTFQNGGQTPAYDIKVRSGWYPTGVGGELPKDFSYPDNKRDPTLRVIDSRATLNTTQSTTAVEKFIANDVVDVLRARRNEIELFFYGHIDYKDVFGKCRSFLFCARYEPKANFTVGFSICREHNTPKAEENCGQ